MSGVPQGSVLRSLLFLIYIKDLHDNITNTKVFRKVNTDIDKQHLQNDLDKLVKWSEKWQMLFSFEKCKCIHTRHRNLYVNYNLEDTVLSIAIKEKGLGVTIVSELLRHNGMKLRKTLSQLKKRNVVLLRKTV